MGQQTMGARIAVLLGIGLACISIYLLDGEGN